MLAAVDASSAEPPRGVIFTAEEASTKVIASPGGAPYWTPTAAEVSAAERALPEFLMTNSDAAGARIAPRLDSYRRQYAGITAKGRKMLLINAFCSADANWRTHFVVVLDGGDCFFHAYYDVDGGRFAVLSVNSPG